LLVVYSVELMVYGHTNIRFFNIYFIIIIPSTPRYSKWTLSFEFWNRRPAYIPTLSHACHTPWPSHSPWLDYSNNIYRGSIIMKLLTVSFSLSSRHFL